MNDSREKYNPFIHLENINYPKGAGTEGENDVANYVYKTLSNLGYQPQTEEFYFRKKKISFMSLLPFILVLIWATTLVLNIEYFSYNLFLSIVISLFPIFIIFFLLFFKSFNQRLVRKTRNKNYELNRKIISQKMDYKLENSIFKSRNIIASIGPENANNQILFTAHFDSISSDISLKIMKYVGLIAFLGFIVLNGFYFLNILSIEFGNKNYIGEFSFFYYSLLLLVLLSILILISSRLFRSNKSHGIIDDGTGVAILLEVAKFLKENEISNTHIILGFFGSEELGLYGSGHYYSTQQFDKEKLHVISVDMIGEKGPVSYVKSIFPFRKLYFDSDFNDKVESIAHDNRIKVKGINFFYSGSDYAHWFIDGYKCNWLYNPSNLLHSKKDNLDNVNKEHVQDALILLIEYLKTL